MIVSCESCNSKFKLDPSRLKKAKSKVRCSRCGHVFMVSREEAPPSEAFDLLTSRETEDEFEEGALGQTRETPPPFTAANIPLRPPKKSRARVFLLGFLLLALLGSVAFWYLSTQTPREITGKSEPAATKGDAVQPLVTILESTQAYFAENLAGGQIFIVEGEAVNESSKPVSFVLLEGKLYTTRNTVALSQRCYAGNVISKADLTNLPITEIQNRMMNREGTELSNVHIAPGGRVPFMLVFHNLPELNTLSDYSIEVLSAKLD